MQFLRRALERPPTVYIIVFFLGAATVLAFSPFDLFPLAVVTLALLIVLWRDRAPKQAALIGFIFGMGLFGLGVSWVYVSLHDYGGMPAVLAVIATFLFCAVLALFPAAVAFIQAKIARGETGRSLLLIPALWTLSEWVRGWIFTGFPWLSLGYSQTGVSPLIGYAPVLGYFGVSLAVALSAGALSLLARTEQNRWPALAVLVTIWIAGALLKEIEWTTPAGEPITVSLLQGNIPQEMKWQPEKIESTLNLYRELALESKSRLIVLPETALPLFYHQVPDSYTDELAAHADANNGALLFGVPEYVAGQDEFYNSVFTADGKHVYRKAHLVPFGEFIPWGFDWVLAILHIPLSDFSRGSVNQKPIDIAGQKVAVNICYEDAFGEEIIRQLPEATLLVNVSNVAWFGDSIAPWQHMQMSRMRAAETGRSMLRATNSGLTAIINERGLVVSHSPVFEHHVLTGEVRGFTGATPYVRVGNLPVLIIAFGMIAISLVRRWRMVAK